jgi:hypothetical protein
MLNHKIGSRTIKKPTAGMLKTTIEVPVTVWYTLFPPERGGEHYPEMDAYITVDYIGMPTESKIAKAIDEDAERIKQEIIDDQEV